MVGFNKAWALTKTEAQFVAEFKHLEHMAKLDLVAEYYKVTGKQKPEAKPVKKD